MARFTNPFPQYIDSNGTPLSGGQVSFFITDTFTETPTYSDPSLATEFLNANPVILDTAGILPDTFLDSAITYRVRVLRADDTFYSQTDDIPGGGVSVTDTGIAEWSASITYNIPDVVISSDARLFQSITDDNLNNDPTLSPANWTSYTHLKEWNALETYPIKFILQHDGFIYSSRIADNLNKEPDLNPDEWSDISGVGPQAAWIPAPSMSPLIVNGPTVGRVETTTNNILIQTLDFDPTTEESAQFFIQMPSSWNAGTILAQMVWSTTSSATTVVRWGLSAVSIASGQVLDSAFGTEVTVDDANTAASTLQQTSNISVTAAGAAAGEWVVFQIARKATATEDTLTVDARLQGIRLQYTINNAVESS